MHLTLHCSGRVVIGGQIICETRSSLYNSAARCRSMSQAGRVERPELSLHRTPDVTCVFYESCTSCVPCVM
ncbi:hypothetical protein FHG87_000116 [Trinorchestia longiramus]|nr:hypothetical protein FHG87_000116 [Trinorchestia longiramus]